jgi:hypothetical protein
VNDWLWVEFADGTRIYNPDPPPTEQAGDYQEDKQ